ncbi:probable ATP-dependent DNA helicase HFM1 isoform X2 [Scleropages formosus]|uniref:probable ATP-dependent DNA helicase HFM1 isoform X2 n=1 Tax=Scleropages formosus TaxID=113540 RepID=UPI0010FA7CB5|nr:probable ATP-dependent DNA helicase HFM1 isoform X2 [Scleropages formosus]
MLDSEDCALPLDSLFYEGPIVQKVKPLHHEKVAWQLEPLPSESEITPTQILQREIKSLCVTGPYQKSKKFLPPLKKSSVGRNFASERGNPQNPKDELLGYGHPPLLTTEGCAKSQSLLSTDPPKDLSCLPERPLFSSFQFFGNSSKFRRSLFKPPQTWVSEHNAQRSNGPYQNPASGNGVFTGQAPNVTENPSMISSLTASSQRTSSGLSGADSPQTSMWDHCTQKACIHPLNPQPVSIQGQDGSGPAVLRSVTEIPAQFRTVFKEFPYFNYVQSKALDDILYTSKNFVACAPTGSGKTVLFELAIIQLLMENPPPWCNVKVVYMAPIKALCSQRYENWKQKFGPLGLNCKELTGDTEIDDFFEIQDAHLIMTTPEKWDSMTRKWRDNCLMQLVKLFLIDEVHVVKDSTRGATLEVVVSRMKTINSYHENENPQSGPSIAEWLSDWSGPATCLEMDESHRPVKLRKVVLGYPCGTNQTEFKFDLSLNYKIANVIQTYSDQKPTLVFCSTRKGVQQSASVLAKDARFIMGAEHKQRLMKYASSILDSKLRDLVMCGVGFHHAGIDVSDRKIIEDAFIAGDLPVLFTTSTLAMGVNLPAHLVIIKSTMHYVSGACEEYSEIDMLQMIGRAGRPQFDTTATSVIMTRSHTKDKYQQLVSGTETIESSLHTQLVEHLNAEIVLHTISDANVALDWIRSTFLYIRALKNPSYYGFSSNLDRAGIETRLQELCLKNLNSLATIGLITMDEDINFKPTEAGKLMARYCIAFDTMKQFSLVSGSETMPELIGLISKGKEFSDVQLRINEKRTLNTLNRDKNRTTIRYPLEGKIKNSEMKVNCLIQAQLGSIPVQEFGLIQDTGKIFRNGIRITKCLSELLSQNSKKKFTALLNALILSKCFRARLWENSPFVSKQLEKIGLTLSTAMVNAGLTTFQKIEQTNARELELIVNRHPPFGNQIREAVIHLPKYEVSLEQIPRYSISTAEIVVTVNLRNYEQLLSKRTAPDHHFVTLIIGDCDNNMVFLQKLTDSLLLKSGSWSRKTEVTRTPKGEELSVNLISSEFVGLDIQQKYSAFYAGAKRFAAETTGSESMPITAPSLQGTLQKAPSSTQRAVGMAHRSPKGAPSVERGSAKENMYPNTGKRQCNHFCKNKEQCGHDCCKVGVGTVLKRNTNRESGFSSYLRDLKSRNETFSETPVKRLKMKMCEEAAGNIQNFSYQPKGHLPAFSRYEGNYYNSDERADCVESTEDSASAKQMSKEGSYDKDCNKYLDNLSSGEEQEIKKKPQQSADTLMWGLSSSGYRESSLSPVNQTYGFSNIPSSDPTDDSEFFSSDNVNFDLRVDDWDDFDDENLVHASETVSMTQGTGCEKPIGYSAPLSPCEQPKSIFIECNRSYGANYTTIRRQALELTPLTHSPKPNNCITSFIKDTKQCDSNYGTRKRSALQKQSEPNLATQNRQFDFFLKTDVETYTTDLNGRYQGEDSALEMEAFGGILDGIF